MKQFDITVTIRVTVPGTVSSEQYEDACFIANKFAEMATQYKSIGADKIVDINVMETENV